MEERGRELVCSVAKEELALSGEVLKRALHKNAILSLGRNEFRDVVLRMEFGKEALKYLPRDLEVHRKFAKEGKATIKLVNQNMRFMLSNCPPHQLVVFLKTLTTKLECLKHKGFVSDRKRLFSDLPHSYQDISPLTVKDVETLHSARAKVADSNPDLFTPKSKRKRPADPGKENCPPKGVKIQRRCGSSNTNPAALQVTKNPISLTKQQTNVLQTALKGQSVFFTGSAGTGKSYLLKRIIGGLPPQHTFATASTGVAACAINGTTLHAFAGIGSGTAPLTQCIELAQRPLVAQQWRKCRHLIIDEISMVDGHFFDKLEAVARVMKKNDKPFGGIQLILCGDFLQLPPVTKKGEKRRFAFQSKAWRTCIERSIELTEVHRQSHKGFINILQSIRMGRCPQQVLQCLQATCSHQIEKDGVTATRLCTHKDDVEQINRLQLNRLKGESSMFESNDSDEDLTKTIDAHCPVPKQLVLKLGAQVMLTKNLDVSRGLVNGARGVVVGFESATPGLPKVKFVCGETMTVQQERWSFKGVAGIVLSRRQLPLKLAWAISIHKSQGMSLDCVEMSLGKVFECGQAYVALSRARSLQGLRVLDLTRACVQADPHVIKFYQVMKVASGGRQEFDDLGS